MFYRKNWCLRWGIRGVQSRGGKLRTSGGALLLESECDVIITHVPDMRS